MKEMPVSGLRFIFLSRPYLKLSSDAIEVTEKKSFGTISLFKLMAELKIKLEDCVSGFCSCRFWAQICLRNVN